MKGVIKKIAGGVLAMAVAVVAAVAAGCDGDNKNIIEYSAGNTYAIFKDLDGNEIKIYANSGLVQEVPYEEYKMYVYDYEIFYGEDDQRIAKGRTKVVYGHESGEHRITAHADIDDPNTGKRLESDVFYGVDLIVGEKPDLRVKPDVVFDPNGGTVEGEGENIRYVYKYDGKQHIPLMSLKYDGKDIEIKPYDHGIASIKFNGEFYEYSRPRAAGEYEIKYYVSGIDYVNIEDREKYKSVSVTIKVEIRE